MNETSKHRSGWSHFVWLGPVIGIFGLLSYFFVFASWPMLRDSAWLNLLLVSVGVVLSALAVLRSITVGGWLPRVVSAFGILLSGAAAFLLVVYVFSLSYMIPEPTQTAQDLGQLPAITVMDQNGKPVDLAARGQKTVLSVYRGHW